MKVAKALWVFFCIVALGFSLYVYEGNPQDEAGVILAWSMIVLTFPLGLLFPAVASLLDIAGFSVLPSTTTYWSLVLYWAIFLVLGWLQWFKVAAALLRLVFRK